MRDLRRLCDFDLKAVEGMAVRVRISLHVAGVRENGEAEVTGGHWWSL
jgi:hypothetical protein